MISPPSRRRSAPRTLALAVLVGLLGGCAETTQAEIVEQAPQPTQTDAPPPAHEFETAEYRALDEPIAPVSCDDLVSQTPGVVAQVYDVGQRIDVLVEGEFDCRYDFVATSEQGDLIGDLRIGVAHAGDEAQSVIAGPLCCYEGELVPGSDPPRRDSCSYNRCATSFAVDGFLVSVVSHGVSDQPSSVPHAAVVASVERVVAEFEAPAPLAPVGPEPVLMKSCEQSTPEQRSAVGRALGGEDPAFSFSFGSGEDFWMVYWAMQRRGITYCAWSLDDPAGSFGNPGALVMVIPGVVELLEGATSRYNDVEEAPEASTFYFAADGAVVSVYGVNRETAQAIAEAYRR